MDLQLQDKVAIVTGASKGIGLAIVEAFADEGVTVVAVSRHGSLELVDAGSRVRSIQVDLTDRSAAPAVVEAALSELGRIDILVNNVGGVLAANGGFLETSDDHWARTVDFNLMSTIRMCRAALPHLLDNRDGGVIINVSSTQARLPAPMVIDYCAAKAALDNLSRGLAEEFSPQGVRAVTVAPGPVVTPFWTADGGMAHIIADQVGTDAETAVAAVIPEMMGLSSGRMVDAREIAAAVVTAASPRLGALTGSTVTVDAGMIKSVH